MTLPEARRDSEHNKKSSLVSQIIDIEGKSSASPECKVKGNLGDETKTASVQNMECQLKLSCIMDHTKTAQVLIWYYWTLP